MQFALIILCLALSFVPAEAQKKKKNKRHTGTPVLWEKVNIAQQDLYFGPGGKQMLPDLSSIKFIRQEKGGASLKYRIEDGSGEVWVAKIGREAQSETAAVRLLSAIGYKTEVNYLVPRLTIPGKGTFTNVRLEARPRNIDRGDPWKWGRSPFENTPQMRGLKVMMAFINNWDMKSANNVILHKGSRDIYAISDLGVSFGKTGNNSWPLFWRIGRSRNVPEDYAKTRLVRGLSKDRVKIVFNGKNRRKLRDITRSDVRWLADLLTQLSDQQIRDAFRAANYTPGQVDLLTNAVKNRIDELDRAGSGDRLAIYR